MILLTNSNVILSCNDIVIVGLGIVVCKCVV